MTSNWSNDVTWYQIDDMTWNEVKWLQTDIMTWQRIACHEMTSTWFLEDWLSRNWRAKNEKKLTTKTNKTMEHLTWFWVLSIPKTNKSSAKIRDNARLMWAKFRFEFKNLCKKRRKLDYEGNDSSILRRIQTLRKGADRLPIASSDVLPMSYGRLLRHKPFN